MKTPAVSVSPRSWRRFANKFIVISIAVHLLFGVVATVLIVQRYQSKRIRNFQSQPKGPNASSRALEFKVHAQRRNRVTSAPPIAKRVTTTAVSKLALPDMPAIPSLQLTLSPAAISGMGVNGLAPGGRLGGMTGGTGAGGAAVNLFGIQSGAAGIPGTFYDYKVNQFFQPVAGMDRKVYARIVKDLLPVAGAWHPEQKFQHFASGAKLYAKYFYFPAIADTEAGAAFQSPRSGPGDWLAVYRGSFAAPATGTFRFVGFGDNVMIVKVDGRIVLDASDLGFTGAPRTALGNIAFPRKKSTPLFAGDWVNLTGGEARQIEIAVGDMGGIFCSGLFIQPKDTPYAQDPNGVPQLPLFMLSAPGSADRELLSKVVPAECLQGPYFKAVAPAATTDFFDRR